MTAPSQGELSFRVHTSGTDKRLRGRPARSQRKPFVCVHHVGVRGHQLRDLPHVEPVATRQRRVAVGDPRAALAHGPDLDLPGGIVELAVRQVVVAGHRHPVTAPRETETQLQHQPHTAAAARLAAHVIVN